MGIFQDSIAALCFVSILWWSSFLGHMGDYVIVLSGQATCAYLLQGFEASLNCSSFSYDKLKFKSQVIQVIV